MELVKIINMLDEFKPNIISKIELPVYIQTHKSMLPGQNDFFSNCLYVGYVSNLPEFINNDSVCSLICIEDVPLPKSYKNYDLLNLAIVENNIHRYEILNKIADIMIDEAHIVSAMQILLDALYENKGLQYMVDVAFEVFGNPVFVNDTAYKILAMSNSISFEDSTLEEEKSLGYIHEQNLYDMRKDNVFKHLNLSTYPLYSKRKDNAPGWLFKVIQIQNVEVGMVALVETNRSFKKYDFELLERFSKLISIELEKSDFYKTNKGLMYSYFLADLIDDKLNNHKLVEQRLSYLHWKLYSNFQVMFITSDDGNIQVQKIQLIAQTIRHIIPDCRWTLYRNNLVVLLNRPSSNILKDKEQKQLQEFIDSNKLSTGMSNVYSNIMETAKHYSQSLRAADLGIYMNHKPGIYNYSDYSIAYIGKILSKRHDLHEFCPPAIDIIQEYDTSYNTNLLETLEKYLYYPENPVAASESLHIHRNTLLYRIKKIKDLTGIDLQNGDVRLNIQLYFKFLFFQKGSWESDSQLE